MKFEHIEPGGAFSRFDELLQLIRAAFGEQEGRLDPPSSAFRESVESLRAKLREQHLVVAIDDNKIVGCVFAEPRPEDLYISKLATHPNVRGRGLGSSLIDRIIDIAGKAGFEGLSLEVRIALKGNQRLFAAAGFMVVDARSHPGYDKPTFYEMRRAVVP